MNDVQVATGKNFFGGSSGKWAGEQLLRALQSGQKISPAVLRTLDTLRKEEWIEFDNVLVQAAAKRLRGVRDLIAAGLTRTISNGLAKTVLEYDKITDMGDASISLDGLGSTENDRLEYDLAQLPLPIVFKDFFLNLRHLAASREKGQALDTLQVEVAGRKIAELLEQILFSGSKTFGGLPIYGYLTHPHRNLDSFGTNGAWSAAAKTGANCLDDVLSMMAMAEADRMYGPYWLYVPTNFSTKLSEDYKSTGDMTIRERLMQIDGLERITVADQMTSDQMLLIQPTPDVVQWVTGEALQNIQWDVMGGFRINFKSFTIQVPLIRSDVDGRSGLVHMS